MSVQYGSHVRTILLITVHGGNYPMGVGGITYRLVVDTLLGWIPLIPCKQR